VASARGLPFSGWLAVEPGELVSGCRGQVGDSIYSSLRHPQNSLSGGLRYDVIRYEEKPQSRLDLGSLVKHKTLGRFRLGISKNKFHWP
jgi:hypothetical protein